MSVALELDWTLYLAETEDAARVELAEWLQEHGRKSDALELVQLVGPGGGNAVVRMTSEGKEALQALLVPYCGGDVEQALELATLAK